MDKKQNSVNSATEIYKKEQRETEDSRETFLPIM